MKEITTTPGTYPKDGPIEEMRGITMQIPTTVANKREWMESRWREEVARVAAESEKRERNQAVLKQRIEDQQKAESLESHLAPFRDELSEIQQRLTILGGQLAEPDAAKVVEVNANTTANMARTMDASEKTTKLLNQVESLQATVGGLAEQVQTLQAQTL